MERAFGRVLLNQAFLLPTRDSAPELSGRSTCPQVECSTNRVCIEPDPLLPQALCVSVCYDNYCENSAICEHSNANFAPRCFCQDSDRVWYFGERCQFKLEDWLLYIILAVLALVIAVSICVILCLLIRRCRKRANKSEGTYIAKASEPTSVAPESSFGSEMHFPERQYADSMNNTHENPNFDYQRDSGISNESPETITKDTLHSDYKPNESFRTASNLSTSTDVRFHVRPRPGWVPSLGPAMEHLPIFTKNLPQSTPEVTPLDTNV